MLHQPGMRTNGGAHPACSAPLPPRTNINMQETKAPLLVRFITPAPQFMDVLHAMSPPIAWMNRMLPMACFCHTEFVFLLSLHARQIALSWKRTKVPVGKLLPHGQASHWSWLYSRLFLPRLFDSKVRSNNTLEKKYVHKAKQNKATTSSRCFCIWSLSVKCISVDLSGEMIVMTKIYPSALENSPLLLNRVLPNGEVSGRPCLTGEGVYGACISSTEALGSPVAQSGHGSS